MNSIDHIDFGAPAALRKWPSLNGQRLRTAAAAKYSVYEGSLDECLIRYSEKPPSQRHLYEIETSPQAPTIDRVLTPIEIDLLIKLREFL